MQQNGTAPHEQLSDHELAYYRDLLEQAERVPGLQEQQQRLALEITKIRAAQQHYLEYLARMHGLQSGDRVEADGQIVRSAGAELDAVTGG